jgi:ribonuclease G
MKGSVAVLGEEAGVRIAALLVDGKLEDVLIDQLETGEPQPGAIFRAICDRPLKGQGGTILRLPSGNAYLRSTKNVRPGQSMLVQVTGYAEAGKAVPVTSKVIFKSRYAIVTPGAPGFNVSRAVKDEEKRVELLEIANEYGAEHADLGLIIRSAAENADPEEVATDVAAMFDLCTAVLADQDGDKPELLLDGPDAHHLAWREWSDADTVADGPTALDDHAIPDLLEELRSPYASLSGAGSIYIESTRAFVAVDVNTGADTSLAAGLKANIATARALPAQLRCRGLGGQIIVDFAPMPKKDRRQLEHVLKAAFKKDTIDTALAGWTPLGNFELQRKRERQPLQGMQPT